jgi:hypothetical protein
MNLLLSNNSLVGVHGRVLYILGLQPARQEYEELFEHARAVGIEIFASVWDLTSVDFMRKYTVLSPLRGMGVGVGVCHSVYTTRPHKSRRADAHGCARTRDAQSQGHAQAGGRAHVHAQARRHAPTSPPQIRAHAHTMGSGHCDDCAGIVCPCSTAYVVTKEGARTYGVRVTNEGTSVRRTSRRSPRHRSRI